MGPNQFKHFLILINSSNCVQDVPCSLSEEQILQFADSHFVDFTSLVKPNTQIKLYVLTFTGRLGGGCLSVSLSLGLGGRCLSISLSHGLGSGCLSVPLSHRLTVLGPSVHTCWGGCRLERPVCLGLMTVRNLFVSKGLRPSSTDGLWFLWKGPKYKVSHSNCSLSATVSKVARCSQWFRLLLYMSR